VLPLDCRDWSADAGIGEGDKDGERKTSFLCPVPKLGKLGAVVVAIQNFKTQRGGASGYLDCFGDHIEINK